MPYPLFRDRLDAARALADRVAERHLPGPLVVLALPRGGVPLGEVLARRLGAPLDLLLVRKIGAPWQRELAVAAVVDGGEPVLVVDAGLAEATGASRDYIATEKAVQWQEILRRRQRYLGGRAAMPVQGATVIVVDDGIATGTTMRAALQALRQRGAARIVLAVPVAPHDTVVALRQACDELICLAEPLPFRAIGEHYADFHQLDDEEVVAALQRAQAAAPGDAG